MQSIDSPEKRGEFFPLEFFDCRLRRFAATPALPEMDPVPIFCSESATPIWSIPFPLKLAFLQQKFSKTPIVSSEPSLSRRFRKTEGLNEANNNKFWRCQPFGSVP